MCLYSMDTAFTQHKHDKYSLQPKDPKKTDKKIFERQVKLQADLQQICSPPNSITISIG